MGPLEAAKALAATEYGPVDSHCLCHWCREFSTMDPHAPDCPWLVLPQIVAALEALEVVVRGPWMHAEYHGAPFMEKARLALGLDVIDEEGDQVPA